MRSARELPLALLSLSPTITISRYLSISTSSPLYPSISSESLASPSREASLSLFYIVTCFVSVSFIVPCRISRSLISLSLSLSHNLVFAWCNEAFARRSWCRV